MKKAMMMVVAFGLLSMVFGIPVQADGMAKKVKARQAIEQTYLDCLGRKPSDNDITHYMNLLQNGTEPGEVRKGIILSDECKNAINKIFKEVQGSEANEKHLNMARKMLNEGKTLQDVKRRLQKGK